MPEIHVFMAAGRSDEIKKNLMLDITHAVTKNCDVPAEAVTVQIMEAPLTEKMKGGLTFRERYNQAAQKK